MKLGRILGTIRRGRTKIRSPRQMRFLHANRIDHTHFKRNKKGKTVKVRHTYLIVAVVILLAILAAVPNESESRIFPVYSSSIHLVSKLTNCYGNVPGTGSFFLSNGCDNNDSTQYIGGNSNATEWVVFNLTARFNVDHIAVLWLNYPGSGRIDVWTGTSWFALKNYTYIGQNVNQTITLDHNYVTEKIRLYMTGPFSSPAYAGFAEVWIYGDVPPSDFTISSSRSSLNLLANTEATTTISVSGKEGFTGYVALSTAVSDSHAVVICVPLILHINVTLSDCTISADAPGHYTITFIGTNSTIGQTHSTSLSLVVTLSSIGLSDVLTLIGFLVAIVILSFIAVSYHPAFFIPDGIVVLAFGFFVYTALSSLILAGVFVASGVFLIALGAFARPRPKNPIR